MKCSVCGKPTTVWYPYAERLNPDPDPWAPPFIYGQVAACSPEHAKEAAPPFEMDPITELHRLRTYRDS
jgi:hypothetical protein